MFLFLLIASSGPALAGPLAPKEGEKCAVCGMFVHKYPDWVAQILFEDGTRLFFDGAKDMFTFVLRMEKYRPGKNTGDIAEMYVTDYYDLSPIDARKAHYVIGSDVLGPMGRELVPFGDRAAALEFLKDHKGDRALTFGDVTAETLKELN